MKPYLIPIYGLLGAVLAGCHKPAAGSPESTLPAAAVTVQTVERRPQAAVEEVVGTVRPKLSATIESKVSGRIEQMLAVPGQTVKAGELVVQLDAHEAQARFDQAVAAQQQAESEFKRANDLRTQKILSQSEFDSAQSKFRMADGFASEAGTLLAYTKIVAPFDGVITRKLADVGDLAAPGKTLFQQENPAALRLEADVPEALIGSVKLHEKLAVQVAAVGTNFEGDVGEIAPAADPNSRTYLVKLDLPNVAGLHSGQFGRVGVPVGVVNSIRIPAAAVIQRGQMELVFVVIGGKAQMRLVRTGSRAGSEVEVVSGLDSGEQVVTDGAIGLADGQPVSLKP